jgi:transposase
MWLSREKAAFGKNALLGGYKALRDFNAAQNILAFGLDGLGESQEAFVFRRGGSHFNVMNTVAVTVPSPSTTASE